MTKKDYIIIANAIKEAFNDCPEPYSKQQQHTLLQSLAEWFMQHNRKFDLKKFRDAVYN